MFGQTHTESGPNGIHAITVGMWDETFTDCYLDDCYWYAPTILVREDRDYNSPYYNVDYNNNVTCGYANTAEETNCQSINTGTYLVRKVEVTAPKIFVILVIACCLIFLRRF